MNLLRVWDCARPTLCAMRVAVRVCAAGVVAMLAVGCGEGEPADRRPTSEGVLKCTGEDEPTNFDVYTVGPDFEGLPLVTQDRYCEEAARENPPQVRSNVIEFHLRQLRRPG